MRIHIEQLKQTRVTLEYETPSGRFPALRRVAENGQGSFTGPVRTRITAERVGELVEVRGVARAAARQSCSRCLTEFTAPLEAEFELTYARLAEAPSGGEAPQPGGAPDDGLIYFHGDEIDLTGGVQEHLILALPIKPLCRDACNGLCARCGADLNLGPCGCAEDRGGGLFQALGRLKLPKDR
jgi:uncharacterized protein